MSKKKTSVTETTEVIEIKVTETVAADGAGTT